MKHQPQNYFIQNEEAEMIASFMSRRFSVIAEDRKASFAYQYKLILSRFHDTAFRSPQGIYLLICIAFFNGILQACLFAGIGNTKPSIYNYTDTATLTSGLLGCAYLTAFDSFLNLTFGTVLAFP